MKKYLFFISISAAFHGAATAQQLPIFTQYRELHGILNPAAVSSDFFMNGYARTLGAAVRTQWTSTPRCPQTQVLYGEYINKNNHANAPFFRLATGGYLLNDQASIASQTAIYGRISAFGSNDSRSRGFSVGFNFGAAWTRIDAANVAFRDVGDALPTDNARILPDFGVGAFGYTSLTEGEGSEPDNFIYGGVSMPQILRGTFSTETATGKTLSLVSQQHFYFTAGYIKSLGERRFLETSIWLKSAPNVPIHADLNVRIQWTAVSLGAGYSTSQTIHTEATFTFGKARIGYGFDLSQGVVANFGATHELNLHFFY